MAYINVEEEKKIYEDDWLLRKNFIFDMASFKGLYEINDLIIESNDLLKKSALGGISYTDQRDAIKKSDGQIFTIYSFIGEVFGKIQECIDSPLYTGFNTEALFYLGNVKIEEYTTANTLGLTENTTDGVNGAFQLKEKKELTLEDFLLGNLNGNMADYEYYSMFSKLYKEDCKNFGVNDYVRDEYLDGEFCTDGMMNYMGCVDDILTAGEYIHKKDNPWYVDFLKFETSFLIEPIYKAIVGREIFSGEKLTDTESSMAGIKAMLDSGVVLAVGGVVLEETLLIGGKQVVTKTLSKKEYQKVLDQALKEKVNGYKVLTSESGSNFGKYTTAIDDKVTVIDKVELPEGLAKTFTDGEYRTVVTNEEITLYRNFGYKAKANGGFTTTSPAESAIQVKNESAILPEWKNTLQYEAEIVVPKGTILQVGKVAPQVTKGGTVLSGGADQILLPQGWNDAIWIKNVRELSVGGK